MNPQIHSENYKVSSYLVNLRGQAGLYAILNLIQDVGWMHAISLKVQLGENQGWVFTRQKLTMTAWPKWNQTVTIRTWLRPPGTEPFLLRDYEILVGDEKIGECTSTFTVMDMKTRKIALVDWSAYSNLWRQDFKLSHTPAKIIFSDQVEDFAKFEVRNSDIDMNNHVNNTKYAQWVLDAIPLQNLRGGVDLLGYEVNFLAETKSGDVVSVQKTIENRIENETTLIQFQGLRSSDGKPVFTAQLRTTLFQ